MGVGLFGFGRFLSQRDCPGERLPRAEITIRLYFAGWRRTGRGIRCYLAARFALTRRSIQRPGDRQSEL